jgi:hypothetical protein
METLTRNDSLYQLIRSLPAEAVEQAISYVRYLHYVDLEEREDQDDLDYIARHQDKPTMPLEAALKSLGLLHG